jgi:MoaA/NifB/PqqE/SkfB family radical SAM enzyme
MRLSTVASLVLRNLEIFGRQVFKRSPRPYKLLLELTENCNSKCQTCSIWKKDTPNIKQEFSVEKATILLSNYGKNLLWLSLSGGEVTLFQNFDKLIEIIQSNCPNLKLITFTTNGLNPEKTLRYAKKLQVLGCDVFITVSLDGDETTHDFIRGINGNYQKAQKTYQTLKAAGINSYWGITLSELNREFIQSGNPIIKEIKAVTFAHSGGIYKQENIVNSENLISSLERVLKTYEIKTLSEIFEWVYIKLSAKFLKLGKHKGVPCEVISTNLHVKANGDIHPCMFVPAIGKVGNEDLTALLRSPSVQSKIQDYRKGKCPGCWMNCYAPHSMMQNPIKSLIRAFSRAN